MEQRYMYYLVMFDLPTNSKKERSEAAKFRKFLLNEGYIMTQYSIYSKFYKGSDTREKLERRLNMAIPKQGCVRTLAVTEIQFKNMSTLVSSKPQTKQEYVSEKQFSLIL